MRRHRTARRGVAAVALALTLGLTVAACSGGSSDSPSASPSASTSVDKAADQAKLADVKVVWTDSKTKPTITLPGEPFVVSTPVIDVREPGSGAEIKEGQNMDIHLLAVSGKDGSDLQETYSTKPESVALDSTFIFHDQFVGQKVGMRFVFAVPEQTAGDGSAAIAGEVVAVHDVPTRASGTPVAPVAGLPTITLDSTGKPSMTPVSTPAPTTLVVQPLIKGAGPAVVAGQTVTVKYTGWLWDGTQFDSSWDRNETFPVQNIGQAQVITGWNEGLVGQTVGSQVLMVIPPDKGYGAQAQGSIPANSTLVFVVDILAAS